MICRLCHETADENGLHMCEVTGEVVAVASSPELFEEEVE